ncbi:MAG: hypothetical protein O0W93_00870, partial [Methanocorpusculum sp.]|nr:hypothetical protein [Methanocorpusculum sp.]
MSLLSSIRYRTVDIDPDYHQWVSEHRRWGYWSHSTQYLEAYDGFFTYIYRKKRKTQTHGTHEPNSVNFALFSKTKAYNDALEDFVRERLHHSYKVENENDQFKFTHITFETLTAYK